MMGMRRRRGGRKSRRRVRRGLSILRRDLFPRNWLLQMIFLKLRICSEVGEECREPLKTGRTLLGGEHIDLTLRHCLEVLLLF